VVTVARVPTVVVPAVVVPAVIVPAVIVRRVVVGRWLLHLVHHSPPCSTVRARRTKP